MGAIPSSGLPGHRQLHERVCAALDLCQEAPGVDFKGSVDWATIRPKLTTTLMAMGNLRDGGIVIVGVSEKGGVWDRTGISDSHLQTFDVDVVVDYINKYASPPVDVDIVTVDHVGKTFLALYAREFRESPVVCKKNGPQKSDIRAGSVYVRPLGKAQTTKVQNAEQLRDLLELAAEKRARRMLGQSRRIGMVPGGDDPFDQELGDL